MCGLNLKNAVLPAELTVCVCVRVSNIGMHFIGVRGRDGGGGVGWDGEGGHTNVSL